MVQKIIQAILSIVVLMAPMSFIAGTPTTIKSGTVNQSTKTSSSLSGSYKSFSAQPSRQLSNTSNSSAKSKPIISQSNKPVISQPKMTPITTSASAPKIQPRTTQLADQNKGRASSSPQSTQERQKTLPVSQKGQGQGQLHKDAPVITQQPHKDSEKTLPVGQKRTPVAPQEQHHDAPVVHGSSAGQLKKDMPGATSGSSKESGKPLPVSQSHTPVASHEAHHDAASTHGSTEGQQHKDTHGAISVPEHHADTTHDEKHDPSSGAHDMAKGILSSLAGAAVTATLNHFASRSSDASQATPQLVPQTPPDPNISLDDLVEKPTNETAAQPQQQQNQISDEEIIKEIKEEEDLQALEEQPGVEEVGHQEAEKSKDTVQEDIDKDKVAEGSTK